MTPRSSKLAIALMICIAQAATACAQPKAADTANDVSPAAVVSKQGQLAFPADHIHELSGIVYLGSPGNYLVVSDKRGALADARIEIDQATGEITSAKLGEQIITLQGRRDVEAVAMNNNCMLIVADESGPGIHVQHFPSGKHVSDFDVPKRFRQARPNRGFEALSSVSPLIGSADTIWAANEEALKGDGEASTAKAGTLVRLQRFNAEGIPTGQFAYRTEPHAGADNVIKFALSGVSGIVALDHHRLIVMERELGGDFIPAFRNRLYLVDTKDAMDTSSIDSLVDKNVQPVEKTLLVKIDAKLTNFEGITLGPKLDNGDYALVLVSDDGGGNGHNPQNLMTVRVPGHIIEGPGPAPIQ